VEKKTGWTLPAVRKERELKKAKRMSSPRRGLPN
jgi:hypothetical protein